ncbi:thiamine pyrophosphate-dependent dehydrogenase E1 component subunit alpha [Palleronia caenipelagi]|uniref:Thiamine pyrophosphate-dependent dehydrogenase E1 component subunit alpha n=1 Tax=Palleronia caenipelagi TaxID=2489174 RepID=A0A547PUP0_9RHOB|nr:thiamine pyrophosphate-dependent dehydrogenase E1 component subunit alpha [Palleronia caenipelagi]
MSRNLPRETLLEMQRRMLRIRLFDERASKMVKRGYIPGTVHTSIGQEAQVVGACMALNAGDHMTGNHRSHGHPIGMGSPLGPLMAELVGKATGVCGGKGGSLHLADYAVGSLGESGITGSSIPIAVGAGLSAQVLGEDRVALTFFGDGTANQGVLYESMNLASAYKLPAIFLCENNFYALSTPSHTVTGGRIVDRAAGFGMPGVRVEDGQDVLAVYDAVAEAADRARRGEGPSLVEVMTYRFREHSEGLRINVDYRDAEEKAFWTSRDPIILFREALVARDIASTEEMDALEAGIEEEVEACATFALESPDPDLSVAFEHLYTDPYELEAVL